MADMKQCDRCKELWEPDAGQMSITVRVTEYAGQYYDKDLCADCTGEFIRFMQNHRVGKYA